MVDEDRLGKGVDAYVAAYLFKLPFFFSTLSFVLSSVCADWIGLSDTL
jgi:hypothetical protein